jgi:hypothetical protein
MLRVLKPEPTSPCLDPVTRPTRIVLLGQLAIAALLLASFVSGVLIWRGKHLQVEQLQAPAWLHSVIVLHGCLNPLLAILFGYLLCHHIRLGWQMRANLLSGFFMEAAFIALILSGAGLYYAGSEVWRERLSLTHRISGLALPAGLAWHWISGLIWARRNAAPSIG